MYIKNIIFLLIVVVVISCQNKRGKERVTNYEKKEVLSNFENGKPKTIHFILDSLEDIILIRSYYENGQIETEYTEVAGKTEGVFKSYHSNGKINQIRNYKNDKKEGAFYDYTEHGDLEIEYIFYQDEAVYKKQYFYTEDNVIDSTKVILSLMIDSNIQPFVLGKKARIRLKFPLDSMEGHLYTKLHLKTVEYDDQTFPPYYPDSFDLSAKEFITLEYQFSEPTKLILLGDILQEKDGTTKRIGGIGKYFEVVDSISTDGTLNI